MGVLDVTRVRTVPAGAEGDPPQEKNLQSLITKESLLTYAGLTFAVGVGWGFTVLIFPAASESKWVPALWSFAISIFIWWADKDKLGTNKERIFSLGIALLNAMLITLNVLGFQTLPGNIQQIIGGGATPTATPSPTPFISPTP